MGRALWAVISCLMGIGCQSTQDASAPQSSGEFENARRTKRKSSLERILKQIENDSFHKQEIPTAFLFAEAFHSEKKFTTAQKLYGAIFKTTPTLTAGLKSASTLLQTGKADDAQAVLAKLQTIYPKDPRPSMLAARVSLKNDGVRQGFQKIKSVHERFPDDPLVKLQYIQALLQLKKAAEAMQELNRAVEKFPGNSRFSISLARIHLRQGAFAKAESVLKNFLHYSPDHFEALRLYGRIALLSDDYVKAETFLENAYLKRPYDNSVVRDYALSLIHNSKNKEAGRVLFKVQAELKLDKHLDAELALRYGTVLLELQQAKGAERVFKKLVQKRPFQKNFYNYFLANSLEEQNKLAEALNLYKSIPVGDLMGKRAMQSRINILAKQKKKKEAEQLLSQYPLDKEDPQDYRFYASLLLTLKEFDEALKVNAEAIKHHAKEVALHYQTSLIYEKKNGEAAFLKHAEGVMENFPDYAPLLNHYAYTLVVRKERLDHAVKLLKKAVELAPRNGYYLDSLGWAYFQKNNLAKAHKYLLKAYEILPNEPVIMEHLGEHSLRRKERKNALRYFKKALSILTQAAPWRLEEDGEWSESLKRVRKRIEELEGSQKVGMSFDYSIPLPELFKTLKSYSAIDDVDWYLASHYAIQWKLSVADALVDLRYIDETLLAKALAETAQLEYREAIKILGEADVSMLDYETLDGLMNVGALPLKNDRIAICNPYDDHRGFLGNELCEREMVVTERSPLFEKLREVSLAELLEE